jgi:hypothetical protein
VEKDEPKQPKKLGLDRLSPHAAQTLFEFVRFNGSDWLQSAFNGELKEIARTRAEHVAALAVSEAVEDRWLACSAVPYLAETSPDEGFPIWRNLMSDPEFSVWELATEALANSLGVLDLQPEGVMNVVEAHFKSQRLRNQPPN